MGIVVLGWGSLLWEQGVLRLTSRWRTDGPRLPIEFARLSDRGRLTLVIHPESPAQQTYWAISALPTIDEVRANLQARESCPTIDPIHGLTRDGTVHGAVSQDVRATILAWLTDHDDCDGVVWTGLRPKWTAGETFSVEAAIARLGGLQETARDYITKAPPQIQTPVRARARTELGWDDVPLSPDVLEPEVHSMPIDGCTSSFTHLASVVLPGYLVAMRRAMEQPVPLGTVCTPREGARVLRKRFGPVTSGCYVLLRDGKPFYVGISRRVFKRLRQHVQGNTHYDASLAYRMANQKVRHNMTRAAAMRDTGFQQAFTEARALLRDSTVAVVAIENPLELYLFEAYCAMELGTGEWNTFETH
jgi:hypothetical protein